MVANQPESQNNRCTPSSDNDIHFSSYRKCSGICVSVSFLLLSKWDG